MIDGFGWFGEGDYRRAFLLFDQVEYLLPSKVKGPLWYPPSILASTEYLARAVAIELGAGELTEAVGRDLADPGFRAALARVPAADRRYARQVVATDPELAWLLDTFALDAEGAALSVLASKLLMSAARSGVVPIVGKDYAWQLLMVKLRLEPADLPTVTAPQALATPAQQVLCSVLGAGLSLAFVDGDTLTALPFESLSGFKKKHADLLERHQLSVLAAAQQFADLPSDGELQARIAKLRTEAQRERLEIEARAEEAWSAAGLKLGRNAIVAATSGALPLVAFMRQATIPDLLIAALPGAGLALAALLGLADQRRRERRTPSAYLFQAQELADRQWASAGARP